jgi:hypothetical protein
MYLFVPSLTHIEYSTSVALKQIDLNFNFHVFIFTSTAAFQNNRYKSLPSVVDNK